MQRAKCELERSHDDHFYLSMCGLHMQHVESRSSGDNRTQYIFFHKIIALQGTTTPFPVLHALFGQMKKTVESG